MNRKPKQLPKKPFFVRFLDQQALENVSGGRTLKFPSDQDDHGGDM
jgi:hypothetical protein